MSAADDRFWAGYAEGLEIGAAVGFEGIKAAARAVGWLPPESLPTNWSGETTRPARARRPHPHLRLIRGGAA